MVRRKLPLSRDLPQMGPVAEPFAASFLFRLS